MARLSWAGALALLAMGCGQSFSAGGGDAGTDGTASGPETSTGGEAGPVEAGSEGSTGDACVPQTCPEQGFQCGVATDGCGKAIDCGTCPGVNITCDGTRHCTCDPITCKTVGAECGSIPDGCGSTLDCGTCPTGETCGAGGTLKCGVGTCIAKTCADEGATCGQISDGCGALITCTPGCTAPQTCGGGGTANQCGCTPTTCGTLGWQCGTGSDGCGGTLDCGGCDGGPCYASSHSCTCTSTDSCQSHGYTCGEFTDSCNAVETCGPPPSRFPGSIHCSAPDPVYYTCCTGGAEEPSVAHPGTGTSDAGVCDEQGATPPEPGLSCVAISTQGVPAWCCTQ